MGVREDLIEHIKGAVDHTLEQREQQLGPEVWAQVERLILLRTIDTLWVDHLTELDDMRRGIGLRGYGGIDPLNEFKREAFKLYEELRGFISRQVANTIFRVQVNAVPQATTTAAAPVGDQSPITETTADGGHIHADGTYHAAATAAAAAPALTGAAAKGLAAAAARRGGLQFQHGEQVAAAGAARGAKPSGTEGPKLGRNDPCWCGSGKKFKRCHGA